ncbi:pci domain-containing protein 2, partial [Nannochloropsis gaditana CCMP526]|uniref:pci domain-containing protein 2 n=1 Tax=Nannochloropsis gaditana (strain CCMP526) TaxID=1093141 RepID=UPI00029F73A9
MLFRKVTAYLDAVTEASRQEDGTALTHLFSYDCLSHGLGHQFARMDVRQAIRNNAAVKRVAHVPELLEPFLRAAGCLADQEVEKAFEHHRSAFVLAGDLYKDLQEEWLLNLMRKLARGLRLLAQKVDKEKVRFDPIMNEAVKAISDKFRLFGTVTASGRRRVALMLANEQIICYLQLNNPRQCKPLTDWADARHKLTDDDFTSGEFAQADAVTYHFLRARLFLLDTNYKEAERFLTYAFRHCPAAAHRNKRTILSYMVPVKLNLGLLPRPPRPLAPWRSLSCARFPNPTQRGLLERFQLKEFEALVAALRDGDFRLYQEQLDKYQDDFIARGVYIILEKLKLF